MRSRITSSFTLISLAAALALTGCVSSTAGVRADMCPTPEASLLQPFPTELPAPRDDAMESVLDTMKDWGEQYHLCQERHAGLAEAAQHPEPEPRWWEFWKIYW